MGALATSCAAAAAAARVNPRAKRIVLDDSAVVRVELKAVGSGRGRIGSGWEWEG